MSDFLDKLAQDAKETIAEGYYEISRKNSFFSVSLKQAVIEQKQNAVISEVKAASPSRGTIKTGFDPAEIAKAMKKGGATGLSVLTEPKQFKGSLNYLIKIRDVIKLPILMKDIILSPVQIEAGSKLGANVVLLIKALFDRGYCEESLEGMIALAHSKNLEVLLETHNESEFNSALQTDADLVGINNRDLRTLEVHIKTTEKILEKIKTKNKVVVSESGILVPSDIVFLRNCGADAFLIGSSIMMSDNLEKTVKEFVNAQ
ncbi:MAG: indole-3-glycerol-phosphate synthase [Candidatus Bathyarchaeota archaeon]|nr:indole-3-glycerol-phosphate synthase [Candidatus Bathyarchaeum tardum]WNZ30222.1 MAG: indole-3-glycerol-phosphate synthase [Candidatus Bathyarchaeota archaeon]